MDVSLPMAGRARVEIFDVHGRRVATVVEGLLPSGVSPVVWDSSDGRGRPVAAGVYWARLEALGEVRTSRVVVAR